MKIKYNILWLEDSPMKALQKRVIRYIEELGFNAQITNVSSLNDLENIDFKVYDIILLDYHLNDKQTTDEILKKIKKDDIYSEIIFYSDKIQFPEYIKLHVEEFEGVFWNNGRERLVEKVIKVIDLTLKKFQDLNNLRGLVMAEVADLENLKGEIITLYNKIDCDKKEEILSKTIQELSNRHKNGLEKLENIRTFDELMDKLDLSKKSQTIDRIKRIHATQSTFNHKIFNIEIIKKRNLLAHVKEGRNESGKEILQSNLGELIFSDEEAKLIRKDILKYKLLLEEIKNNIEKNFVSNF